jgi:hypothetical protein
VPSAFHVSFRGDATCCVSSFIVAPLCAVAQFACFCEGLRPQRRVEGAHPHGHRPGADDVARRDHVGKRQQHRRQSERVPGGDDDQWSAGALEQQREGAGLPIGSSTGPKKSVPVRGQTYAKMCTAAAPGPGSEGGPLRVTGSPPWILAGATSPTRVCPAAARSGPARVRGPMQGCPKASRRRTTPFRILGWQVRFRWIRRAGETTSTSPTRKTGTWCWTSERLGSGTMDNRLASKPVQTLRF